MVSKAPLGGMYVSPNATFENFLMWGLRVHAAEPAKKLT